MDPREAMGSVVSMLLPIEKLKTPSPRGVPFEQEIHDYLSTNLRGYTVASGNISGHWRDRDGHDHYGEHREYKVAMPTVKTGIQNLQYFIATLAHDMQETCIYVEWRGEAYLIYGRPTQ
jgi:hypothetical protein